MADNYKEFDKASIITSDDISIKGYSFRKREIALVGACLVALVVCVILAALLASANSDSGCSAVVEPSTGSQTGGNTLDNACLSPICLKSAAFIRSNLNMTMDPCNNFYQYACGSYVQNNPLHPDYSSQTVNSDIYNENQQKLRRVLEMSIQRHSKYSAERKMKDYFNTCIDDYGKMLVKGNPFLQNVLPKVGGWYVLDTWNPANLDFMTTLKAVHTDFWTNVFFAVYVRTDWFDWTKKGIQIDLSGMGMPWVYYIRTDQRSIKIQNDYKKFVRAIGTQLVKDAQTNFTDSQIKKRIDTFVDDVYTMEKKLAILTNKSKATQNPHNEEERVSLADLNSQAGSLIDWVDFFSNMFDTAGVTANTKVVILEKEYILQLNNTLNGLGENRDRIINNYYIWRLAHKYVQELSWEYIHANREYYVDVNGRAEFLGTWRYCLNLVSRQMGHALSALFVRDHFVDKNKDKAMEIVNYVKNSLIDSIMASKWIEQETKEKARQKLKNSAYKLGYPENIMNNDKLDMIYSSLDISLGDHFSNTLNFNRYWKKQLNNQLQTGTDRTQWNHQTFDVAAEYYNPWSELIIPAGMLQFPIYDYKLPHYSNFGSIGTMMSHQLVHAIDEYGKLYKLDGTWWGTWWTNTTIKRYADIKKCVIDAMGYVQQGPYKLSSGPERVPLNTQRYSPEAIAESSGIKVAYEAYHRWTKEHGNEKKIPGVTNTNEQMFFISYAQSHCFNRHPAYAWSQAMQGIVFEDTKINLALSQLDEFKNAFSCKAGDEMVAEKKCGMY